MNRISGLFIDQLKTIYSRVISNLAAFLKRLFAIRAVHVLNVSIDLFLFRKSNNKRAKWITKNNKESSSKMLTSKQGADNNIKKELSVMAWNRSLIYICYFNTFFKNNCLCLWLNNWRHLLPCLKEIKTQAIFLFIPKVSYKNSLSIHKIVLMLMQFRMHKLERDESRRESKCFCFAPKAISFALHCRTGDMQIFLNNI